MVTVYQVASIVTMCSVIQQCNKHWAFTPAVSYSLHFGRKTINLVLAGNLSPYLF